MIDERFSSQSGQLTERNGQGRKITDTKWFENLANAAAVAQEAWTTRQPAESWQAAWERAQNVSADRITEIGVLTTRNAVRDFLKPRQPDENRLAYEARLLGGRMRYFAGLADDVVDGARARVNNGEFASEHGPLYDALSDRWREVRIVDELIGFVENDFAGHPAVEQLILSLHNVQKSLGGPSVARAYRETQGFAAMEQTTGSSLDRNLELFRLTMLVSRGRLETALTLAKRMEQAAVDLTTERLAISDKTPMLPERGRERKQHIARQRFVALLNLMQQSTGRDQPDAPTWLDYWQSRQIKLPTLTDQLSADETNRANTAVTKIMQLDKS